MKTNALAVKLLVLTATLSNHKSVLKMLFVQSTMCSETASPLQHPHLLSQPLQAPLPQHQWSLLPHRLQPQLHHSQLLNLPRKLHPYNLKFRPHLSLRRLHQPLKSLQ